MALNSASSLRQGFYMGRIHGLWSGELRPVLQLRTPGPTEEPPEAAGRVALTGGAVA